MPGWVGGQGRPTGVWDLVAGGSGLHGNGSGPQWTATTGLVVICSGVPAAHGDLPRLAKVPDGF